MRFESWSILADQDIGKVIIGILVFVVWGIGSLASMVKKANEEARRRAISRPPVTPTRAPAPTDQRMVVGGFATGARVGVTGGREIARRLASSLAFFTIDAREPIPQTTKTRMPMMTFPMSWSARMDHDSNRMV